MIGTNNIVFFSCLDVDALQNVNSVNISRVDPHEVYMSTDDEYVDTDQPSDDISQPDSRVDDSVADIEHGLVDSGLNDGQDLIDSVADVVSQEDQDLINSSSRIEESVPRNDSDDVMLVKDKQWDNIYKCREYLRFFAIQNNFKFRYVKNDSDKIIVVCKDPVCKWRCYIRRMNDGHAMRCRNIQPIHLCVGNFSGVNEMANAPLIATVIEEQIRMHHRVFTPKDVIAEMWFQHKVQIKYWQGWNAMQIALERVHGSYEESYLQVPELCRQIQLSNPGSIASFSRDETFQTFSSFCLSFKACIDGFIKGCRPILGLDGCHLKGKYGGVCLAIVGLDADNGMFPIAVFICRKEDTENWVSFLDIMAPLLSQHPQPLTIMSDRQKGLDTAVRSKFPSTTCQRFCFRHILGNMRTKWRGVDLELWNCARAFSKSEWKKAMEKLEKEEKGAHAYLSKEEMKPEFWTRSHFSYVACSDHNTNNWTESFNKWILAARDKPIVQLAVKLHTMQMKLIYDRRIESKTWDDSSLVPRVIDIIDGRVKKMNEYTTGGSDEFTYQVTHMYGHWWTVDIAEKTCTCNEWQVTGIPCQHAVSVLALKRVNWVE